MDHDRLQDTINRAEETEAAQAISDGTARGARERSSRERFRVTWRRARILMALLLIVVLVGLAALFLVGPANSPSIIVLVIWGAMFIGWYIAWFFNWRCPVCGAYLGTGFWGVYSVRHCMNCGARLA